ncbi:MAG: DUF5069 domain-containing protein [Candidatus Tumulicola sp.]
MEARDLQATPPRRWSERLGGIYWLPRSIDKARAALIGRLGTYLFGQSPIDRGLLSELGLSHRDFAVIVKNSRDDEAVLAALASRDPASLDRARAWSKKFPAKYRLFLWILDVDDGYRATWLRPPIAAMANVIARAVKRLWPSRAAERAADASRE